MTEAGRRFKYWLTRPPRPHGDQVADRNVSFLELFYDLVYVAVIGHAAHHLAEHLTPRGVIEFGVVFALIWIAWVNGSLWLLSHLPITMSIAAAGAGVTSLIAHAHDPSTPESTAWLVSGSVALGLASLIVIERSLADADRFVVVYRPLTLALAGGVITALAIGWVRPALWLLLVGLVAILSVIWAFAVYRFLGVEGWADAIARPD